MPYTNFPSALIALTRRSDSLGVALENRTMPVSSDHTNPVFFPNAASRLPSSPATILPSAEIALTSPASPSEMFGSSRNPVPSSFHIAGARSISYPGPWRSGANPATTLPSAEITVARSAWIGPRPTFCSGIIVPSPPVSFHKNACDLQSESHNEPTTFFPSGLTSNAAPVIALIGGSLGQGLTGDASFFQP